MLDRADGGFGQDALPDLEQLTYLSRTPSAVPDAADTFAAATLYRAFRRAATRQDLLAAGLAVSDEPLVFQVWQDDLDQALTFGAQPYDSYALADASAGTPLVTLTNNSAAVTLASTAGLLPGMAAVAAGLPAGTQVRSVDSATQVTLTAAATRSGVAQGAFGWLWVVERVERHQSRARWDMTCRKGR